MVVILSVKNEKRRKRYATIHYSLADKVPPNTAPSYPCPNGDLDNRKERKVMKSTWVEW